MTSKIPIWFNNEFVLKLLRESEMDDSIEVSDVTTEPATGKGDNYMSDIVRASVEYSRNKSGSMVTETKTFIMKISPTTEGTHKTMVSEVGVFETEIKMASKTLVKMNEMLTDEDCRLGARVLHTEIGDPSVLVLEDLRPLGFRMADRQAGLDFEHCTLVMRALANFHATSVALCEKDPKLKTEYVRGLYNKSHPDEWKNYFKGGVRILANEVDKWIELGHSRHSYSKKLLKLSESCYEKAIECITSKDDDFNVINHGDAWVNNMLFRYNDQGKVIDHIFVDFQLSVWASPTVDILYFLSTSSSSEVNVHHRDELINEYVNTLTSTMIRIGCETRPPTMETFKITLEKHEIYSVLTSCMILPLILMDKSDVINPNDMLQRRQQNQDYVSPALTGRLFRKTMVRRLPVWDAKGLLDV